VTFHESFWVAIATAAPVLGLASVITHGSAPPPKRDMPGYRRSPEPARTVGFIRWLGFVHILNLFLQVTALTSALFSLDWCSNAVPPIIGLCAVSGGFMLLIISGFLLTHLTRIFAEAKQAE
jgi:hypothetical protein